MAMRLQIIDAFTGRPFAGNPAAVVLLEDNAWPAEQWMQQIGRRDEPVRDRLRPQGCELGAALVHPHPGG